MFGLKWLWKSNKTNIDTSNFVSKEFLNTTLQDYVLSSYFNTTISKYATRSLLYEELAKYHTKAGVDLLLTNYVKKSLLNTTLSSYVQTDTLNTTLTNYVQTSNLNTTLNNYVSTNTAQTITGDKTFNANVVISNNPTPLILKSNETNNNKTYMLFRSSDNNTNFSLGANSGETSLEVNRGNLILKTLQSNKNVVFENVAKVKLNRSVLECGTEINAGYGGATVKFIPEDNSTKTLQFYNSAAGDTRRFNLLVPEPSNDNSPATKRYVDRQVASVNVGNVSNQLNELNTFKTSVENSYGYNLKYRDFYLPGGFVRDTYGIFTRYSWTITSVPDIKFMSAVIQYGEQENNENIARDWDLNYSTQNNKIIITLKGITEQYETSPTWTRVQIRLFYIDNLTSRTENPFYFEGDN